MDVPHPGPRPPSFEFPFEAARAARAAALEAAEELRATARRHEAAADEAMAGFAGSTRDRFEAELAALIDGCRAHAEALEDQAAAIDTDVTDARERQTRAQLAQSRWERDLSRWREARQQQTQASPS